MSNLLIQQYGKWKRAWLNDSPYSCLLDTHIDINPHQVDAFCRAVDSLKTGGIILADEVGLGKTIEAGLVLKYVLKTGAKKVLLVLPSALRKQWEIELEEKFELTSKEVKIVDRKTIRDNPVGIEKLWLLDKEKVSIAITSYDFSSKLMKKYPTVKWDFVIIDEAHNLRNVFHGTKRAKRLYDATKGIPKILLTATPLQNRLSDLHGLVSYIDDRIFGTEKAFNYLYEGENGDYASLKENLLPVLHRTLRKDVSKYMKFAKRECHTFDFELTYDERILYTKVNNFLKRDTLYCLPTNSRSLIILIIRKLLASSSFALIETFEVMRNRLEVLREDTRSAKATEGFELFWQYLEDEIDEDDFEEENDEFAFQRQQIDDEIRAIDSIIETAEKIEVNAKINALLQAVSVAFAMQKERGINEKVVIFTESKRTQKYIADELIEAGYDDDDIVLFNGENSDRKTKEIYERYQAKNFGKVNYGPSIERKHAIVDYFKNNAKILILTDAGSEGLNLQFCNTVINYDLPWNPMKIEQRIGRCHRYGQENDVVAINLLNTTNAADKRVYEILSKKFELFDGVFGASNIALGILESGVGFEKTILEIYQKCESVGEFNKAFDKLSKSLDAKRNVKARELRNLLLTKTSAETFEELDQVKLDAERYLRQVEYWENIEDEDLILDRENYWRVEGWGERVVGSHGYLFIGAMCDNRKVFFPVLVMCDEDGNYIDFDEDDLLPEIEKIDDGDIFNLHMTDEDRNLVNSIYDKLYEELIQKHKNMSEPIKAYNRKKIENWKAIQMQQYQLDLLELVEQRNQLIAQKNASKEFGEKVELGKKADALYKQIQSKQDKFYEFESKIEREAEAIISEFDKKLDMQPFLMINIMLKF